MSTVFIEVVNVDDVVPHPNADRLEVAVVRGATICVQKLAFTAGQKAIYFPPDMLIPQAVGDALGVANYLKTCKYPGDLVSTSCRVAGCKLRGQPSFGFLIPADELHKFSGVQLLDFVEPEVGTDVTSYFDGVKYEPPERTGAGDATREVGRFHRYTDIDNINRHPNWFQEGQMVRITEKIHGTNSRVGLIRTEEGFEYMAGSNKVQRKRPAPDWVGDTPLYWQPLDSEAMLHMLAEICNEQHDVVCFGEIYGTGIQDMDYGTERGYRVFDIAVDGKYLNWADLKGYCEKYAVEMVPLLYEGPYSREVVERCTYGPTSLADGNLIRSPFKGREGCVVTPLEEVFDRGRLILKSVSADYLDRKGAVDNA